MPICSRGYYPVSCGDTAELPRALQRGYAAGDEDLLWFFQLVGVFMFSRTKSSVPSVGDVLYLPQPSWCSFAASKFGPQHLHSRQLECMIWRCGILYSPLCSSLHISSLAPIISGAGEFDLILVLPHSKTLCLLRYWKLTFFLTHQIWRRKCAAFKLGGMSLTYRSARIEGALCGVEMENE